MSGYIVVDDDDVLHSTVTSTDFIGETTCGRLYAYNRAVAAARHRACMRLSIPKEVTCLLCIGAIRVES